MTHPNIIYILADDMGYGDVSCLNERSKIITPHLDRLAAEGLICRDAHASSAVCTPSRYSILTGRYNWRSRLKQGVSWGYSSPLIEEDRLTVASFLQRHGYNTGCVGKWHLGWSWGRTHADAPSTLAADGPDFEPDDVDFAQPIRGGPLSVGFDYFFGIPASLDMAPYVYIENDRVTALPTETTPGREGKEFWRAGPCAPDFDHEQVLPTLTRKAVDYVNAQSGGGTPFFLYFPLPAPHTPILPTAEYQGKTGTNAYGDFCLMVDAVVGQILAALEQNGTSENTVLIFTSDNGCSPRADFAELHALGHRPSYHFRGHKADIYEGGHRVPLLIRWPQVIAPKSVIDETLCLADLLATCAEIVGTQLPDNAGEDSVSNLPLWQGHSLDRSLREATVHSSVDGSLSIRKGRWKLEMCPGSGGWSHPRPGPECAGLPPVQLYDLKSDVGEKSNVAGEYPHVVDDLTQLLTSYVLNGRSTPGAPQQNADDVLWPQLWWMEEDDVANHRSPSG